MAQNESSNGHNSHKSNGKPPKWTIMVYLAGDGNLSSHSIFVLQQLEAVAYRDDVRILACFDSNTPVAKGSRYLDIRRKRLEVNNGFDWGLHNDLVPTEERGHTILYPDFCEPNPDRRRNSSLSSTVAAEGVKRFIDWAVERHGDSEKYMLVFVGHGPLVASQTFLAKENPPSFMRLSDLRNVLSRHFGPEHDRKLNILACNNCVMNGIETAVEVKDLCDFMIGSQGLMLTVGWAYQDMIAAVVEDPKAPEQEIIRKMLKVCARNLLDFTLMDRSSEQSVCDLTKFGNKDNVLTALTELVGILKEGLAFRKDRTLQYPAIADAVKLARLEAQSYWGETFVDLYDFCERLLKKCNDMAVQNNEFLKQLGVHRKCRPKKLRQTPAVRKLNEIVCSCLKVLKAIEQMVPQSFYIGPELQYSHGLSIYFPWTRPEAPYFFTGIAQGEVRLRTAFQTYREYTFDRLSGWTTFLEAFFKATLRRVRRADRSFQQIRDTASLGRGFVRESFAPQSTMLAIDLQKSSSDTGKDEPGVLSTIKNYPRRNYLSPADCGRKILETQTVELGTNERVADLGNGHKAPITSLPVRDTSPPVSYLGWNISGLVAEVITPPGGSSNGTKHASQKQTIREKSSNGTKRASRPIREKSTAKV